MRTYRIKARETRRFVGRGLKARLDPRSWVKATVWDIFVNGGFENTRRTHEEAEEYVRQAKDAREAFSYATD